MLIQLQLTTLADLTPTFAVRSALQDAMNGLLPYLRRPIAHGFMWCAGNWPWPKLKGKDEHGHYALLPGKAPVALDVMRREAYSRRATKEGQEALDWLFTINLDLSHAMEGVYLTERNGADSMDALVMRRHSMMILRQKGPSHLVLNEQSAAHDRLVDAETLETDFPGMFTIEARHAL